MNRLNPIKLCIIGQGRSGFNIHAKALQTMSDLFSIEAVADAQLDRCESAKSIFRCRTYTDYKDMLKQETDCELVVNTTPSHLHVTTTEEIVDAGFHALCEKPLAKRVQDVDHLMEKAQQSQKIVTVFQQARFAPYFQQVKKIVDSGILGRIIQIMIKANGFSRRWDWQTLRKFDGGSLLNTGPHPLDQALQILNTDVTPQVFCIMDRIHTLGDAEDHVKLILRAPERPVIDLEITSSSAFPRYTYEIYAEYGGLVGDMEHIQWKYIDPHSLQDRTLESNPLPDRAYCKEELQWQEASWTVPPQESDMMQYMSTQFYTNLYYAIRENKPLAVTLEQIRQQVDVIEQSHAQNP